MSALGERLKAKKFATKDVILCLDQQLVRDRDAAVQELAAAERAAAGDQRQRGKNPRVVAAQKALDAAEEAARGASITLRFTAVPFPKWNEFMAKNPPRKGKQESFNTSTFFMYAARRSGVFVDDRGETHEVDSAEWDELEKTLTDGEHDRIAAAIVDLNRVEGARGLDFLSTSSTTTPDSSETSDSPETSD